ncbi:MAG: hypothetical protein ABSH07_02530 [Candidatus Dormibacteria bacterium]
MRGQAVTRKRTSTVPYQIGVRTSRSAREVLDQVDLERVPGITVAERGAHYLVLRPKRRFRYGADLAAGLGVAVVLVLLILTAVTPVVLVGLPAALLPALPLLLDHRPDLALSAIEDDGTTRVTAHGQASPDLAEYLDRYLEGLPPEGKTDTPDGRPPDDEGTDDPYAYEGELEEEQPADSEVPADSAS